jgi:hypothetical protein
MQLFPFRAMERKYLTPFEGEVPDFFRSDFRFFASERLGGKIIKLGNKELFPCLHKLKDLEIQEGPVSFHSKRGRRF